MQNGSPRADSAVTRKMRRRCNASIDEANALETLSISGLDANAEFAKRRECSGQKPLSAGFIDRRLCAIHYDYGESPFPRGDGRRQSRRPASDN
jgi:hypothetical protein